MIKKQLAIIIFFILCMFSMPKAVKSDGVYGELSDTRYQERYDMYLGIEYNMPYEKTDGNYTRRSIQLSYAKKFMLEQNYIEISMGREKVQHYTVSIDSVDYEATNKGFQTKLKAIHFFNNTILNNFYYVAVSYGVSYEQTSLKDYKNEDFFEMRYANHLALYIGYEIPFDYEGRKNTMNLEVSFDVLPYIYGFSSDYVANTNRLTFTIGYKHYF